MRLHILGDQGTKSGDTMDIITCLAPSPIVLTHLLRIALFTSVGQFSGFPFASAEASARLASLTNLGSFWTLTRIVWGLLAVTAVVEGWLVSTQSSAEYYSIVLVSRHTSCSSSLSSLLLMVCVIIVPRRSRSSCFRR